MREKLGAMFIGEAMRDGSFYAFDLVNIGGENITRRPLRERWAALQAFKRRGVAIVPSGKLREPRFVRIRKDKVKP